MWEEVCLVVQSVATGNMVNAQQCQVQLLLFCSRTGWCLQPAAALASGSQHHQPEPTF